MKINFTKFWGLKRAVRRIRGTEPIDGSMHGLSNMMSSGFTLLIIFVGGSWLADAPRLSIFFLAPLRALENKVPGVATLVTFVTSRGGLSLLRLFLPWDQLTSFAVFASLVSVRAFGGGF